MADTIQRVDYFLVPQRDFARAAKAPAPCGPRPRR